MAETGESHQINYADDDACEVIRDETREFVREVLRRTRIQIKTDLKPDNVLDVFMENLFFGESTNIKVRDIKEQPTTTEKNDKIVDESARSSQKYVKFKTSLKRTGQDELLAYIERMEITVHEEKDKDDEAVNKFVQLAQLKCSGNIEPYVPRKELANELNDLSEARATAEQLQSSYQGHDRTSILQTSNKILPFPVFKVVFIEYYDLPVVAQAKREAW